MKPHISGFLQTHILYLRGIISEISRLWYLTPWNFFFFWYFRQFHTPMKPVKYLGSQVNIFREMGSWSVGHFPVIFSKWPKIDFPSYFSPFSNYCPTFCVSIVEKHVVWKEKKQKKNWALVAEMRSGPPKNTFFRFCPIFEGIFLKSAIFAQISFWLILLEVPRTTKKCCHNHGHSLLIWENDLRISIFWSKWPVKKGHFWNSATFLWKGNGVGHMF